MSGQRGKAGLLLTMTLEERRELHRQTRAVHQATAVYVMAVVREGCGLGGAPVRKAESITSRLARTWVLPGSDEDVARKQRRRAERAAGAAGGGGVEGDTSSPREDPAGGGDVGRPGPNSGDAA